MANPAPAANCTPSLQAQLAGGGGVLLIVGVFFYLFYTHFLCFDYCGSAERYANQVLQAALVTLGSGVCLISAAVALRLRALWRTKPTRAFRGALAGTFFGLVVAALFVWCGGTWIEQTQDGLSPSDFDLVTATLSWRLLLVAVAMGVVALALIAAPAEGQSPGQQRESEDAPGDQPPGPQ
jgi:hypothetical protein